MLEADYRPPAKKGDLIRLIMSLDDNQTIVGLVDGYFLLDYPPTPIEVYQLNNQTQHSSVRIIKHRGIASS